MSLRFLLLVVGITTAGVATGAVLAPEAVSPTDAPPAQPSSPRLPSPPEGVQVVLPPDAIRAIDAPEFVAAGAAQVAPSSPMLLLTGEHEARAYSLHLLNRHEIVNDHWQGVPIAVTWCPLCHTAIVWRRAVQDRVLTLGVSGMLLHNSLVMFDRETRSLWSQVTGECLAGPLVGHRLEVRASVPRVPWSEARRAAGLRVLSHGGQQDVSLDHYAGYHRDAAALGIRPGEKLDARLPGKELVVGVLVQGRSRAYPLSALPSGLVLDQLAGVPIVVVGSRATGLVAAYRRVVGSRTLVFSLGTDGRELRTRDGSRWNALTGERVGGPAGERLTRAPAVLAYWFGWSALYPGSELYDAGAR
jgi:hypothetical protein